MTLAFHLPACVHRPSRHTMSIKAALYKARIPELTTVVLPDFRTELTAVVLLDFRTVRPTKSGLHSS